MNRLKAFIFAEIEKPFRFLITASRFLAKAFALYLFRLFLWSIVIIFPFLSFFLFVFHSFTGTFEERLRTEEPMQLYTAQRPQTDTDRSIYETLERDFEFWLRKIKRIKR